MFKQNVNILLFGAPDFLAMVFFIIVAFFLAFSLRKYGKFFLRLFLFIALEHLGFTFFYWLYTFNNVADSVGYYSYVSGLHGESWFSVLGTGSNFIHFVLYPMIWLFKLNYLGTFFLFSLTGLVGMYYLIRLIIELAVKYQVYLETKYFYLLLLPSLHFWTVATGKDAMMFMFLTLFIYGMARRKFAFFVGMIGAGFIRPHVLLMIFAGLGIGYVFLNKRISIGQKIFMLLLSGVGMYILLPMVMEKVGMSEVSLDSVNGVIDRNLSYSQDGGSSVDMSNANFLVKMLSYLFRPFFFDINSAFTVIVSFENIAWVYIIYQVCRDLLFKISNVELVAPLFFSFFMTLVGLSSVLNNMGVALRQKNMLFPFLLLLLFITNWYKWMMTQMRHQQN